MSQLSLSNLHTKRGLSQQNRPVETEKDEDSRDTQLHIWPTCFHYLRNFLFIHEKVKIGTNIYNVENINQEIFCIFH